MDQELVIFLTSVSLLILYLVFSALTEMGTKLPWKNNYCLFRIIFRTANYNTLIFNSYTFQFNW